MRLHMSAISKIISIITYLSFLDDWIAEADSWLMRKLRNPCFTKKFGMCICVWKTSKKRFVFHSTPWLRFLNDLVAQHLIESWICKEMYLMNKSIHQYLAGICVFSLGLPFLLFDDRCGQLTGGSLWFLTWFASWFAIFLALGGSISKEVQFWWRDTTCRCFFTTPRTWKRGKRTSGGWQVN